MSKNSVSSEYFYSSFLRYELDLIVISSFWLKSLFPVHSINIMQPRVQQSILTSEYRLYLVSGALHSLSPVPPFIMQSPFLRSTATLKSITLTVTLSSSKSVPCMSLLIRMLSGLRSRWARGLSLSCKYLTVHPENCDPVRHLVDPTVVN